MSEPFANRELELADGRRLSVRLRDGDGEPLVMLHGLLDCAEGWDPLAVAVERPSIAFDLPGFGGSDLPLRPRISAYADDVLAGLDLLGVESWFLAGHSLGGAVATAMAERAAARTSALILVAPAGFGRIHLAEAVSVPGVRNLTQALLPFAMARSRMVGLAYTTMVTNGCAIDEGTLTRTLGRAGQATPGAREATRAVVAAGLSERAFHRRPVAYPGPVWAVWGDRDRLVPPGHADAVRRAFPHAIVERWKGVGHHPLHECPERFLAFVDRALRAPDFERPARARGIAA
ncbi:MAG: alpha/beta fold hydrolase [Thermoleophilaceae bacterium]|nr:alpha/beta fold hydrolase [Thermoleophilaceae bacterium]